ncbi:RecBCD enzyme subunit RecC [Nymphon striatum]|nr:RecBCD enzyme subunit RecC [Nymphon striatum]
MLTSCFQSISSNEKFLGYGITFCALVPMRSVPFRVVSLIGMNDGEFPRQDKHHSFDLMAKKPLKGDRSRRDEDQYCSLIKNEEISSQAFIEQPLSEPDASYKNVHLNDLILFYKNPARYFLKHRFSIQTFDDDPSLEIREPFELESFKDKEVRNLILDTLSLETKRSTDPTLVARAKVRLPMYKKPTFANTKEAQDRWQGNDRYAGEKDSFENWLLHRNLAMDKNNLPKEFIGN